MQFNKQECFVKVELRSDRKKYFKLFFTNSSFYYLSKTYFIPFECKELQETNMGL